MKRSRAQIIATIGPASKDVAILSQMINHQMDVARLNFSWGTYEEHAKYIRNIRQAAEINKRKIPIIQDLSGPRIKKEQGHGFDETAVKVITDKDLRDLEFGIAQDMEYVAMSYVGGKEDIIQLREKMRETGRIIPIIAKIERKKALDNLDEIISAADAIMVARGDLGDSIPIEQVPFVQKDIIQRSRKARKPVIVATQMLVSMVDNPEPTRAEVTDVSIAISEGSDAVMLSEETAKGEYPVETVAIMEKIVLEAEKHGYSKEIHPL